LAVDAWRVFLWVIIEGIAVGGGVGRAWGG